MKLVFEALGVWNKQALRHAAPYLTIWLSVRIDYVCCAFRVT
jgi:hypothetical protein